MRYLLLLTLLTGCSSVSGYEPDTNEAAAIVAAQIAFHEPEPADTKPDVQTTCTKCEGKKQVLSGDKISWVACPCGENCKCEKVSQVAESDNPYDRMLMFTATWCGPCQNWKNTAAPAMRESNWLIGESDTSHIQIIDSDANPDLVTSYSVRSLPTFIMIDGSGNELRRSETPLTADQTVDLYKGRPVRQIVEDEAQQQVQRHESQPAMVTRRSKIISRGCRGGRCF